jgi:hypothetical protein
MRKTLLVLLLFSAPAFAAPENRVEVPAGFPEVKLTSSFASDFGFFITDIQIQANHFSRRDQMGKATEFDLKIHHWSRLSKAEREYLAMKWTREILLRGENVLETLPEEFTKAHRPFQPPTATTGRDGTVTVALWQQLRSGMRGGVGFAHHTYVFTRRGRFSEPNEDATNWRFPAE